MPMSATDRAEFLAAPHVAILAVSRAARGPLAVPVWYDFRDGEVLVWTRSSSRKAALIQQTGRFSLAVQHAQPPYGYVTVEGPVTTWQTSPATADLERLAGRYLPPAEAAEFVKANQTPDAVLIGMRPESWLSADLGQTG